MSTKSSKKRRTKRTRQSSSSSSSSSNGRRMVGAGGHGGRGSIKSGGRRKKSSRGKKKIICPLTKGDYEDLYKSFQVLVSFENTLNDSEYKTNEDNEKDTVTKILENVHDTTKVGEISATTRKSSSSSGGGGGIDTFDHCQVCFLDFDEDVLVVTMDNCSHEMICTGCFETYIKVKVRDKEIMPWLICPDEKCKVPIANQNLLQHVPTAELVDFVHVYLQKTMVRAGNWAECSKDKCDFGFLAQKSKKRKTCKACGTKQTVSLSSSSKELDDGFQKMVKEGIIRLCPTCKHPAMKDYGMCNIMECGKCSVWWNWKTKETGKSYSELKNRARMHGVLWEPGELQYQLNLQRNDPEAFRDLLERNGIKYDPNFVRGQS